MIRETGTYRTTSTHGETVRAFLPHPLPPAGPPLLIEGTQATLRDVATFEATSGGDAPADVEEVCNYVEAVNQARAAIADPGGLPLSTRLLCDIHRTLMRGVGGKDKLPGEIRRSQTWIGGSRPGNALFVPPPPEEVPMALAAFEHWLHAADPLPPLVKAGLAHAQFETIHPFLDGNGRIGRMLITLLAEHWGLLDAPLLYLSLPLKRRQADYYGRLTAIRTEIRRRRVMTLGARLAQEA